MQQPRNKDYCAVGNADFSQKQAIGLNELNIEKKSLKLDET